jgi:uncharacterized protein YbaP (TraB family)
VPVRIPFPRRLVSALLVAALLAAPAVARAPEGNGKGFMWRIERDGRTGWLVGSIHVLTPDYYPLPPAMQKAFLRSVTLMEEIDLREMAEPGFVAAVQTHGLYSGADTLQSKVSPDVYRTIAERLTAAGVPAEAFQRMKPWLVALTLVTMEFKQAGFDPAYGLDAHFFEKAPRLGKKFRALETAAGQVEMFASLDGNVQEAMLRQTVKEVDLAKAKVTEMANAWRRGDAPALEKLMADETEADARVNEVLLVKRNRAWLPQIEDCLEDGLCFVVVGAGHLVGKDGLLASLKAKGYSVTQE